MDTGEMCEVFFGSTHFILQISFVFRSPSIWRVFWTVCFWSTAFRLLVHQRIPTYTYALLWLLRFTSLDKSLDAEDISCLSWNSMKYWTYSTTRFRQFIPVYRKSKMGTHTLTQHNVNVCIVSECVIKIKKTKKTTTKIRNPKRRWTRNVPRTKGGVAVLDVLRAVATHHFRMKQCQYPKMLTY